MSLHRYIFRTHIVPASWIDSNDCLIDKHAIDIERECEVINEEVLSSNYDGETVQKDYIKSLPEKEGFKYIRIEGSIKRDDLDCFDKNQEFCERAEMQNPKLKNDDRSMWEYLHWCFDELLREEFNETGEAIDEKNYIETIDGACDVAVVALNIPYKLFRKMGFLPSEARARTREAFDRVVESNLVKLNPQGGYMPIFREDGKVMKPDYFKKPVFDDLFEKNSKK